MFCPVNKVCSFDCVYCHYGRTRVKTLFPQENHFPSGDQVLQAVKEAVQVYCDIDYLTFSGNGEPTLHPHFSTIVSGVRRLLDELGFDVKLTILSNSTTVHLPFIRESLLLFDAPIMKLDAGDVRTLACVNRPAPAVELENIIEGLGEIPRLIIQSVLVDGKVTNIKGEAFEAWLSALSEIEPARVQIYSTDRPVSEAGVERVPPSTLQCVARDVETYTGLQVDAYWSQR